jgi:hypothetical protein
VLEVRASAVRLMWYTVYSNLEMTRKTYVDLFIVYFTHYVEIMDEIYDR